MLESLSLTDFPEQGWTQLRQSEKGHLILDLLPHMPEATAEVLEAIEDDSSTSEDDEDYGRPELHWHYHEEDLMQVVECFYTDFSPEDTGASKATDMATKAQRMMLASGIDMCGRMRC